MRKILIFGIVTILIIVLGSCYFIYKDKYGGDIKVAPPNEKVEHEDTKVIVYEEVNTTTVEEVDNNEQNTVKSESKVEEKKHTTTVKKQQSTQVKKEVKQESLSQKTEAKKPEKNIVVPEQKEETTTEKNTQDEIVIPEKEETEKEETKEEVIEEKEEVPQVKDEYKRNNAMIEQMKNVIKNNESDLMKELGYNIVVDSSIITETNQFTFTEFRVKNKIINAFGTIKIYAQDYYHNGQYMYTECYLM